MTARCCAGPRHSAETPPVGYAPPPRVKRCPFGAWIRLPQGGNGRPVGTVTLARRRAGGLSPWPT